MNPYRSAPLDRPRNLPFLCRINIHFWRTVIRSELVDVDRIEVEGFMQCRRCKGKFLGYTPATGILISYSEG